MQVMDESNRLLHSHINLVKYQQDKSFNGLYSSLELPLASITKSSAWLQHANLQASMELVWMHDLKYFLNKNNTTRSEAGATPQELRLSKNKVF